MDRSGWLKALLHDCEGPLLAYVRRYVPEEQAREVVQESFLRLWNEDQAKVSGHEKEWLFRVCRNIALDILKKTKRVVDQQTELESKASEDVQADVKMEMEQQQTDLLQRMKRLTRHQEEVIRLKFVDGFAYKEISSITGHSVSYVGVLIHEAIKILKEDSGAVAIARAKALHGGRP